MQTKQAAQCFALAVLLQTASWKLMSLLCAQAATALRTCPSCPPAPVHLLQFKGLHVGAFVFTNPHSAQPRPRVLSPALMLLLQDRG